MKKNSPSHQARYYNATSYALLLAGLILLYQHLMYLNASGIMQEAKLSYFTVIKFAGLLSWIGLLVTAMRAVNQRLQENPHLLNAKVTKTLWRSGLIFIVTVVPYKPFDIDLSMYFFVNTLGYALLLYGLFRLDIVRPVINTLGRASAALMRTKPRTLVLAACLWSFIVSYFLSGLFFNHIPSIDDTIAQYVQAKYMAGLHYYEPLPQFAESFRLGMMINDGNWYSQYPPGHILLLTLGLLLNHPEAVNPLLGAGTCIATYLLAKEAFGTHTAKIAALLSMLCIYIQVVSSEYMNNATALFTITFFVWSYFRILNHPRLRDGLWGGLALGFCFITRPYSAFYIALPLALYALYRIIKRQDHTLLKPLVVLGAVTLCFIGYQLHYNQYTTGDFFSWGYQKRFGDWHNPFTAQARQRLDLAMLDKNFILNIQRASQFNKMLFEWPLPVLILLVPLAAWRGHRRNERLLFVVIASIFFSCLVLPGNIDRGWGPRLAYEVTAIFIVLIARSLTLLPALMRGINNSRITLRFYYGSAALILISLYMFSFLHPLQPANIQEAFLIKDRQGDYPYYQKIVAQVEPPALVFMPRPRYKFIGFNNPPSYEEDIIFANDLPGKNAEIMHFYTGRNAYIVRPALDKVTVIKCMNPRECTNNSPAPK